MNPDDNMDIDENTSNETQETMDIEHPVGSQDMFANSDDENEKTMPKKKINVLNDREKSEKRIMKNLNETLSLLQKSSTKDAMEQRKIIASAVFDHRLIAIK